MSTVGREYVGWWRRTGRNAKPIKERAANITTALFVDRTTHTGWKRTGRGIEGSEREMEGAISTSDTDWLRRHWLRNGPPKKTSGQARAPARARAQPNAASRWNSLRQRNPTAARNSTSTPNSNILAPFCFSLKSASYQIFIFHLFSNVSELRQGRICQNKSVSSASYIWGFPKNPEIPFFLFPELCQLLWTSVGVMKTSPKVRFCG